uniref:Uncharacterized protein n=1 Tax=Clostridioides difficile TaxID=1496 RepID=A0A381I6T4_CLODI|nr:Uncharacterised protein [Clostridioides difficile]
MEKKSLPRALFFSAKNRKNKVNINITLILKLILTITKKGCIEFLISITSFLYNYSTFAKNAFVLSCFGFPKTSSGVLSSSILPPSIKITLSATSLANPIS